MTVTLVGPATGSNLTGHDALYAYPSDMQTNGTVVTENAADTGLPRITLADAATQRVKWVWAIPVRWDAVAIRFAAIPEVATGGNVVFQFAYRLVTLGSGSVQGAVTNTIAVAAAAMGVVQFNWNYLLPAELSNIAMTPGGFGDSPFLHCSLARLGANGSDTLAGGCSIGVVTATRVPSS